MRVLLLCYSITVPASSSVIVISAMLIVASVFMFIGSIIVVFYWCLICNIEIDDHESGIDMLLLMVMI